MNTKWNCCQETLKSAKFMIFFCLYDYQISQMTVEHFFYIPGCFVHHFIAICEFKLLKHLNQVQTGVFMPMRQRNLVDDLETLYSTYSTTLKDVGII